MIKGKAKNNSIKKKDKITIMQVDMFQMFNVFDLHHV